MRSKNLPETYPQTRPHHKASADKLCELLAAAAAMAQKNCAKGNTSRACMSWLHWIYRSSTRRNGYKVPQQGPCFRIHSVKFGAIYRGKAVTRPQEDPDKVPTRSQLSVRFGDKVPAGPNLRSRDKALTRSRQGANKLPAFPRQGSDKVPTRSQLSLRFTRGNGDKVLTRPQQRSQQGPVFPWFSQTRS